MILLLSNNKIITKVLFLFSLFLICACASPKVISEKNVSHHLEKSTVDLTAELDKLPRVKVTGYGRLANIRLNSGCELTYLLNGQVEQEYSYIYDIVEQSTLKSIRIQSMSDAVMFGLRPGGSSLIVIETE